MNLFSRLSELLAGNVSALLDREDDVQRAVARIIEDMENALNRGQHYLALLIAAEKCLAREQEVRQKKGPQDGELQLRQAAARRAVRRGKETLRALKSCLAEARQKQQSIHRWHQVALARADLHRTIVSRLDNARSLESGFDCLARALDDLEAELVAEAESEDLLMNPGA